jgi:peptide-methionine (R)-S-oxide reductase
MNKAFVLFKEWVNLPVTLSPTNQSISCTTNCSMNDTPPPFTDDQTSAGFYVCATCGTPLFEAGKKFEAGCGFPSFWKHVEERVKFNRLTTYGRERVQLLCNNCGRHLGHLFPNQLTPTGVRYCISHEAIRFGEGQQPFLQSIMATQQSPDELLQFIREHRSSEGNFDKIAQELETRISTAQEQNDTALAQKLQEVKEKYGDTYTKAKETSGSAWPEFEKFITQLELALTTDA